MSMAICVINAKKRAFLENYAENESGGHKKWHKWTNVSMIDVVCGIRKKIDELVWDFFCKDAAEKPQITKKFRRKGLLFKFYR